MQHCRICCHPERAAIDAAIRAGAGWDVLAARWNLSPVGLAWHAFAHLRGYNPAKPSAPLQPLVEPETPAAAKVNPNEDAYWRAARQAMVYALEPFPAALDAVRAAFIALDPDLFEEPALPKSPPQPPGGVPA
ncbi:MAG: hypothetical protein IPM24_04605 [Bryobacterales bacterium]|nr:hypothetical protein [Bryobacterales bacterium]